MYEDIKAKCDGSIKQEDDDSDKIKQFAKITAMDFFNESVQLTGESPIKGRD